MVFRILSRVIEAAVIGISGVIVAIVTAEVGLRYLFSSSLIFTEELSRYLMVWVVFLGSAIAVRDGSHIRITMVHNRLPARLQRVTGIIANLMALTFLAVTAVEGIRILPKQLRQMPVTFDVSLFYFYLAIPVGCILMMIFIWPGLWQSFGNGAIGGPAERR
jgi:TRAP-type C4-dicarboxylate transport system permease small subunit